MINGTYGGMASSVIILSLCEQSSCALRPIILCVLDDVQDDGLIGKRHASKKHIFSHHGGGMHQDDAQDDGQDDALISRCPVKSNR